MAMDVVVLGAGVIGLTTAVRLAEAGRDVLVLSEVEPERTTSAAAGAMLGISGLPPDDPVSRWTAAATPVFDRLADDPDSGVHRVSGRTVTDFADEPPPWARALPGFRPLTTEEARGFRTGMAVTLPFADMPAYLGHLQRRLSAAGGKLELRRVDALAEAAGLGERLVNATGSGARELCADRALTPVRGVHLVLANPGITEFYHEVVADPVWTTIFPFPGHVVVGGCGAPEGAEAPSDEQILARATAVEPRLADAALLGRKVGWRPVRATPRLERADLAGTPCVHAYGHGGIGVTVSWGVADEVVRLLDG